MVMKSSVVTAGREEGVEVVVLEDIGDINVDRKIK